MNRIFFAASRFRIDVIGVRKNYWPRTGTDHVWRRHTSHTTFSHTTLAATYPQRNLVIKTWLTGRLASPVMAANPKMSLRHPSGRCRVGPLNLLACYSVHHYLNLLSTQRHRRCPTTLPQTWNIWSIIYWSVSFISCLTWHPILRFCYLKDQRSICEHQPLSSSFLKGLNCPQIQFLSKIPMDQGIPSPCALLSVAPVSHTSKKKAYKHKHHAPIFFGSSSTQIHKIFKASKQQKARTPRKQTYP